MKGGVCLAGAAAVGGKKERDGPLGQYLDITEDDARFAQETFEDGESEMQRLAVNTALAKCGMHHRELELILAGDLLDQCVGSAFGAAGLGAPFIGLYGACSTMAEALLIGALAIESGHFSKVCAATSSHFCAAERQFRFPLEYGSQRPPTAQWTVTGAGAFILTDVWHKNCPRIAGVMPGRIVDKGIKDAANMGAAMAPAAADTLLRFFRQTGADPASFDAVVTGDLGAEGHRITRELLLSEGVDLGNGFADCGLLIYDLEKQDVHAGGSGCGCSAAVSAGYFMKKFESNEYKNILLVGTGALMNPGSAMQGKSIPGVAHLVHIIKEGS